MTILVHSWPPSHWRRTRHSRRENNKKSRESILYFFQHSPATEKAIQKLRGEQAPDCTCVEFNLWAWNTE